MEENYLKKYGMESLDSSELLTVRGGLSLDIIRKLAQLVIELSTFIQDYWRDFYNGYKKGWEML